MPVSQLTLALGVALAVLLAVAGYRAWQRSRITPEERERVRREALAASGKMGDGSLVDIRDNLVFYSYHVGGVEYTASQDVGTLLPSGIPMAGPVAVKYDARNPANSIVVAEQWSGLRSRVG